MNNDDTRRLCEHRGHGSTCSGRREFLVRASAVAGSLALALSIGGCGQAQQDDRDKPAEPGGPGPQAGAGGAGGAGAGGAAGAEDVVLKLDGASPLGKVGGSQTIETAQGKVIVARTGEATFAAVSAVCTHKGGPIRYDEQSGEFFCPLHNSHFDKDGKVLRPPARQPLRSYASHASPSAVSISLQK